jgi:hypothetical protein
VISFNEILHGHNINDVPMTAQINIQELVKRINIVRAEWNTPMIVTSGFRTWQEHASIYYKLGKTAPKASSHLSGEAVDIADANGHLYEFLQECPEVLEKADLYCELGTRGWCHFQTKPFRSYKPGGTRWFKA